MNYSYTKNDCNYVRLFVNTFLYVRKISQPTRWAFEIQSSRWWEHGKYKLFTLTAIKFSLYQTRKIRYEYDQVVDLTRYECVHGIMNRQYGTRQGQTPNLMYFMMLHGLGDHKITKCSENFRDDNQDSNTKSKDNVQFSRCVL